MGSAERRNRRDKKKPALSMQKSAEAIVPRKRGKGGTKAAGVTGGENTGNGDCSRTDSTECKGKAREPSTEKPESGETEVREPGLLEAILDRENLNRAYKRVKANKPGSPPSSFILLCFSLL